VSEEALKNLGRGRHRLYRRRGPCGRHPRRQDHAEGREPDDAGEKLLRAIFGEKASDVRDTSLRVPPGVTGTIVEVRCFNRHGVDKDERAQAIEREEIERLAKDRDDEQAILDRNTYAALPNPDRSDGGCGPEGLQEGRAITRELLDEYPRSQWWQFAVAEDGA
jgi:DNA-directed RNA polymerase subunit beta